MMIWNDFVERPAESGREPVFAALRRDKRRAGKAKWPLHATFAFVAGFNIVAWAGLVGLYFAIF